MSQKKVKYSQEVGKKRNVKKTTMNSAGTFLFKIILPEEKTGACESSRTVIVEVEPDCVVRIPILDSTSEDTWQDTKQLAHEAAMQIIQKDLPHGFEPPYSMIEIEKLPPFLQNRPPEFQGSQFCAWLL